MARLEPEAAEQPARQVALDELVRSVIAELGPLAADKRIALSLARATPTRVVGSEDALRLLATNLVDNAIRYTPAGGCIDVSVGCEGSAAVLQVCDDGPGIPEDERARVFDRFYRGANVDATGSGLGLAIVRQVADLHRGRVELGAGLAGRGLCVRFIVEAPA
jgi:two-component system, OmpR family, sensor kinase